MAPECVKKAFRATRALGIPDERTKPVLKRLLEVYDKKWELIEQEEYRVLIDAIFESEEAEEQKKRHNNAEEAKKKEAEQADQLKTVEEETQIQMESKKPLKRQQLRNEDDQASPSCINPNTISSESSLKKPKLEINGVPDSQPMRQSLEINGVPDSQPMRQSPAQITEIRPVPRADPQPVSPLKQDRNNGSEGNNHFTPDEIIDIANGHESVTISLVNEVNNERRPSFHYISSNAVFQDAYVNSLLVLITSQNSCSTCTGNCLTSPTTCPCALQTGGEFTYTNEGTIKENIIDEYINTIRDPQRYHLSYCKECPLDKPKNKGVPGTCKGHLDRSFIKECCIKCGCSKKCGNRVVQGGVRYKLQVFMTPGSKGWGLRALEDLPKGAFVCEFVGEVLTCKELYNRNSQSGKKGEYAYPIFLDADWGEETELQEDEALCLDAKYYGNVARFINHRCFDPNLIEIPVEIENRGHHYYHLAFFTTRKVKALEELTRDYGIDFDDNDDPVPAFDCECGSRFCRNIKGSNGTCKKKM